MTTSVRIPIDMVDLIAAIRHDRRIATAEGFPSVAGRANNVLQGIETATVDGEWSAEILLTRVRRCAECRAIVNIDEAHSPTAAQCLDDDWIGDELWHETCCPYCPQGGDCATQS